MARRFYSAVIPVVNLAEPVINAEKAADGDIILPEILYSLLFNALHA